MPTHLLQASSYQFSFIFLLVGPSNYRWLRTDNALFVRTRHFQHAISLILKRNDIKREQKFHKENIIKFDSGDYTTLLP